MLLSRSLVSSATGFSLKLLAGAAIAGLEVPALAQVERYLWGPGSNVGPSTKVEPKNCVTGPDGSITCDTQIVNPPGDTPARPQYSPFKN
jgi:hypothetical protein